MKEKEGRRLLELVSFFAYFERRRVFVFDGWWWIGCIILIAVIIKTVAEN